MAEQMDKRDEVVTTSTVHYKSGDIQMEAYLARPKAKGTYPA